MSLLQIFVSLKKRGKPRRNPLSFGKNTERILYSEIQNNRSILSVLFRIRLETVPLEMWLFQVGLTTLTTVEWLPCTQRVFSPRMDKFHS